MLTQAQVTNEISARFRPFVAFITQIANLFVDGGVDESTVLYMCVSGADLNAQAPTPAAYRLALIEECEIFEPKHGTKERVMAVPLPGPAIAPAPALPAAPVNHRTLHAGDLELLANLRTVASVLHGKQLAAAAKAMVNWFHWVNSGPRLPDFSGQGGLTFGPKTIWTKTLKDTGVEEHEPRWNHFAQWIVMGGNPPDSTCYMNCWESVLFSAFQAHLVDKIWLQTIHRKSAIAFELNHRRNDPGAAGHYFDALSQAFNFTMSVPFEPLAGLIPRVGELLFWDKLDHVAISLGRTWVDNEPEDRMISLWHHNGGKFSILTLEDMPAWMRNSLRFVPCPF